MRDRYYGIQKLVENHTRYSCTVVHVYGLSYMQKANFDHACFRKDEADDEDEEEEE